jgi:hypothetical protein
VSVHSHFHDGIADIHVDGQHLSRLTHSEVREIVLQCVVFGGKKLREEVKLWLNGESLEQVAQFLSKEEEPISAASSASPKEGENA